MNNILSAIAPFVKKNVWALAAFLIPLAIRCIPEITSWPYVMGVDTQRYIAIFESGIVLSSPLNVIRYHFFYSWGTLLYDIYSNGILIIKIFGPLLLASIAFMMYLYAKRGLNWSGFKSFLVALLVATYFVSLRVSWDLFSQTVGLIFLLASLIVLKSNSSRFKYLLVFAFVILTVLSHELATVILFFVLGFEAIRFLAKKMKKDFVFLACSLGLAFGLFYFIHYTPQSAIGISVPSANNATIPSLSFTLFISGLLVYCYGLLVPFVVLGFGRLRDWVLRSWTVLCLGIPLITMVFPNSPLYFWDRWTYLLVYPLLFFAVEGLDRLWHFCSNSKTKI
jgi:hypothetical protein